MKKLSIPLLGIFAVASFLGAGMNPVSALGPDLQLNPKFKWVQNGGATSAAISIQEFNGRMYQAIRGNSSPYKIYVRSSADGIFDGSDAGENWDATGVAGNTSTQVAMSVLGPKLYLSVRGNSGNIFTKGMTVEGVWDSTWNDNGGATSAAVAMSTVNFGDGDRMYQAIKGNSSNNIFTRYTKDGVFDGGEGENWAQITGQTPNEIGMASMNGFLFMSVRGNSGEIWNSFTADGVWDGESGENFTQSGGKTSLAPSLASDGENVYQIIKGNSSELIYTRATWNGVNWTDWVQMGGTTQTRPGMGIFNGEINQAVRGNSGQIFTRKFPDLVSFFSENEPWSFEYFNFFGDPTNVTLSPDQCANGDGLEIIDWDNGSRHMSVGIKCTGAGSSGEEDVTLMKTSSMLSMDGKTFTIRIYRDNIISKYFVSAGTPEGNVVQIYTSGIATYNEALQWETDTRAIISTLVHEPTPTL